MITYWYELEQDVLEIETNYLLLQEIGNRQYKPIELGAAIGREW